MEATALLPRRPLEIWPSFTSADDRAALRGNPLVQDARRPRRTAATASARRAPATRR